MLKQKSKPDKLTDVEFEHMQYISDFNEHHSTNFTDWNVALGEVLYDTYTRWYNSQYTKLGRALK